MGYAAEGKHRDALISAGAVLFVWILLMNLAAMLLQGLHSRESRAEAAEIRRKHAEGSDRRTDESSEALQYKRTRQCTLKCPAHSGM